MKLGTHIGYWIFIACGLGVMIYGFTLNYDDMATFLMAAFFIIVVAGAMYALRYSDSKLRLPVGCQVSQIPKQYDQDIQIVSNDSGKLYVLNPARYVCSCPDFVGKRHTYVIGDPRRGCKHLNRYFAQSGLSNQMSPIVKSIMEHGYPLNHEINILGMSRDGRPETKTHVLIGYGGGKPWVNVYTEDENGTYQQFGFNRFEQRWSYDRKPPSGDLISQEILRTIE